MLHVYLHRESRLRLMAACLRICTVCIKISENGSCQNSTNAYANGYGYGSLYIQALGPREISQPSHSSIQSNSRCSK